jgi:hypothetical protein
MIRENYKKECRTTTGRYPDVLIKESGRSRLENDPARKFVTLCGTRQNRLTEQSPASVVVVLALVRYGEDRHVAWTVDLEQRHVSRVAERDHELWQ